MPRFGVECPQNDVAQRISSSALYLREMFARGMAGEGRPSPPGWSESTVTSTRAGRDSRTAGDFAQKLNAPMPRPRWTLAFIVLLLLVSSSATVLTLPNTPSPGGISSHPTGPAPIIPSLTGTLVVNRSSGTVGEWVATNGTGFPAKSSIGFVVGGLPVVSDCRTGSGGDFPGTTGTPCTFQIPALPGAGYSITAGAIDGNFSGYPGPGVGLNPEGIVNDSALAEYFVTNTDSDSVSVISATTDAIVATVGVGYGPSGITFVPGANELFVVNGGSDNISVISAATDTITHTISVGQTPVSDVYDPTTNQVFVANSGSDNLSVINVSGPQANTVVTSIPVSPNPFYYPTGLAYDPATREIAVTGDESPNYNLTLVSDVNDSFAGIVLAGGPSTSVAYDPAIGDFLVANNVCEGPNCNGTVSIIDPTTGTNVTVPVGPSPRDLLYDPDNGLVFVVESPGYAGALGNLSTINTTTDLVTQRFSVGVEPQSVALENETGQLMVTDSGNATVTVAALAPQVQGSATLSVNQSVEYSAVQGHVGLNLRAAGTGYSPNSSVEFSVNGVQLSSTGCATDASGTFPGATADPCTLIVPPLPAGVHSIVAYTNFETVRTVQVGSDTEPYGIVYDSGTGELFFANQFEDTVTVAYPSNETVIATVPVGSSPTDLAYDPGTNEVFVTNTQDNSVSVISDATDLVVATIALPYFDPEGIVYDPNTDQIFVADYGSAELSVIDDQGSLANTVVANVPVGDAPWGIALDTATGQLLVANANDNTLGFVTVSSNVADDVMTSTTLVGFSPAGVTYDPNTDQIFVVDDGNNYVTVVSGSTQDVVASIPVGPGPISSVYDPASNAIIVTDDGANFVTVISDSSDSVLASLPVGTTPYGATYDSASQQVVVANEYSVGFGGSLSVIDSLSGYTATKSFTVTPNLQLEPQSGPSGSSVEAVGTGFGAGLSVGFTFSGSSAPSSCTTSSDGSFPGGSGAPCNFTVPTVGVGSYPVQATDGTNTAALLFNVTTMSLSTNEATVGTTITASGVGFPSDSRIGFTVGGVGVTSSCNDTAGGSFPGTAGGCSFTVPAVPAGSEVVSARAPSTQFSTSSFYLEPYAFVGSYDPSTNQFFVVNVTGNVLVFSAANDSLVDQFAIPGSVQIGVIPLFMIYVAPAQAFYVVESGIFGGAGAVVEISAVTDSVVSAVQVAGDPEGMAYDTATGELFIANNEANSVSVIDVADDNFLVTSVVVGNEPAGVAYDPTAGEIFVTNNYDNTISVITDHGPNVDTVIATWPVGNEPGDLTYDAATNELFVVNEGNSSVTVLNATTGATLAIILLTGNSHIVFDGTTGQLFVANDVNDTVSVISDLNLTAFTTIPIYGTPTYLVYDEQSGQVLAVAYDTFLATVIDGASGVSVGSTEITVAPSLTTQSSVDVGQPLEVLGNGYGATQGLTDVTLAGSSVTCLGALIGTCTAGMAQTDPSGTFEANFTVPSVPESGTYDLTIADAAGNSATVSLTIDTDPVIASAVAYPASIDLGQTVTFNVSAATSGAGGYTYAWYGLPPGCVSANALSVSCQPANVGLYNVTVSVNDTNGDVVDSVALPFYVYADPTAGTITASLGSGRADAGQNVTFTTSGMGGTGDYSYVTWYGLPSGCTGVTASVTCSGDDLPSGTYTIEATVTDSNGLTSVKSSAILYTVLADPTVSTPVASPSSADVGQNVTFTVTSVVPAGPNSRYVWLGLPTGCASVSEASVTCRITTSGTSQVSVRLTDPNNDTVTGATSAFTAYADPSVGLNATAPNLDLGMTTTLTASVAGGSGTFRYAWTGLPSGCSGLSSGSGRTATATCTPTGAGSYAVRVRATDSNGISANSTALTLVVAPAEALAASASTSATTVGQQVTFTADGSGGTGALSYAWEFGDGTSASGATVSHAFSAAGNYTVTVWVNDTVGGSIQRSLAVVVSPAPSSSTSPALGTLTLVAIGVVAVAVVVALLILLMRRRSGPNASKPSRSGEPAPAEQEAGGDTGEPTSSDPSEGFEGSSESLEE